MHISINFECFQFISISVHWLMFVGSLERSFVRRAECCFHFHLHHLCLPTRNYGQTLKGKWNRNICREMARERGRYGSGGRIGRFFESAISSITIVRVLRKRVPICQLSVLWEDHTPSVRGAVGMQWEDALIFPDEIHWSSSWYSNRKYIVTLKENKVVL